MERPSDNDTVFDDSIFDTYQINQLINKVLARPYTSSHMV